MGNSLGVILLAVWFILISLQTLTRLSVLEWVLTLLLTLLAIVVGVLLILDVRTRPGQNLGRLLLAISLLLFLPFTFPGKLTVIAFLSIAAGVLLILEVRTTLSRNLGWLLGAIWLILRGLSQLFILSFQGQTLVMAILAAAAGVLLLMRR